MSGTYLVISAMGKDRPGIVDQISHSILDAGGNIADSRMTVLGGEFAVILLVEGNWDAVAKLEDSLPAMQEELGLVINSRRTEARSVSRDKVPYEVEVVSLDHPGIVHEVASFFSARGINIEDLNTSSYAAALTGSPMFSLEMMISIPATENIADLRDDFLEFCDERNLDATIEPVGKQG